MAHTGPLKQVVLLSSRTADERKTLAAVRGLAHKGVRVTLGSDHRRTPPRYSRHCDHFVLMPDPAAQAGEWADFLAGHFGDDPPDAVLPLCDYSTRALSDHRERLADAFNFCLPPAIQLARAGDKLELLALARDLGIGIPRTCPLDEPGALDRVAREIGFPCVIKLRRGAGGVGLAYPGSVGELRQILATTGKTNDSIFSCERLAQEYIPGDIHDACVLFRHGEPRAALTQRRLVMNPPSGGVGIYNETTNDPELLDHALRLMRALQWHGPAQVEFKRDSRTGRPVLMEVNPRFWGTLGLSIRAGINFPWLAALIAAEGDVEAVFSYRTGLRMRWAFHYGSPQRPVAGFSWGAVLNALPGSQRCSDLWWSDPAPHLAALRQMYSQRGEARREPVRAGASGS